MAPNTYMASVASAFKLAAADLGIAADCPRTFRHSGRDYVCEAHLTAFGSPGGIWIKAIDFTSSEMEEELATAAEDAGLYCSLVNVEVYRSYERQVFIDALKDWGYFGSANTRPVWL